MHIYRWDLDKTYLQTDFGSIRGLVRSATEPATAKRAVPGATPLMRALGARPGARIFLLSGSPEQMREVLEQKLRLDGVHFERLVLKDSLRHIRKGEVRALKGQFGYKLPALLRARAGLGAAVTETLFGDDAEVDAIVYSVYADAISGRLRPRQVSRIMEAAGAYGQQTQAALRALADIPRGDAVGRIFIRLERHLPSARFAPLGRRVVPVHSWLQAAFVLLDNHQLSPTDVEQVLAAVRSATPLDDWSIGALAQDIVRRGHASRSFAERLVGPPALLESIHDALSRLPNAPSALPPIPRAVPVDYLALLRS